MAVEYITQLSFVSLTPGTLQPNGTQPATVLFASVDSPMTVSINTSMADPITSITGFAWLRVDDTNPNVIIPTLGVSASESTAPVTTVTVQQMDAPVAQ